jgi:hypothetical protein
LISFCQRREFKFLFEEEIEDGTEKSESEMTFRITCKEFFTALNKEIEKLPEDKRNPVFNACERIYPAKEIRPLRIDNRGSPRCSWDGCNSLPLRGDNDARSPFRQFIFTVYGGKLRESAELRKRIKSVLDQPMEIGKRSRHAPGSDPKRERKILSKVLRPDQSVHYCGV